MGQTMAICGPSSLRFALETLILSTYEHGLASRVIGRIMKKSVGPGLLACRRTSVRRAGCDIAFTRAVVCTALCVLSAPAQVFSEPPPIIQLVRTPGVNAVLKPYGGAAVEVIGMTTVTGLPESWQIEA